MRLLLIPAILVTFVGCGETDNCGLLLDNIRAELRHTNPEIEDVQVLDAKPRLAEYWVVARGTNSPPKFNDSFENELFAVFVVDKSLTCVEQVVDVFPTPRWHDFELWIDAHGPKNITIRGRGITYHDSLITKTYRVE